MDRGVSVARRKEKKQKDEFVLYAQKRNLCVERRDEQGQGERLTHVTNTIDSVIVTRKWPPRRKQMSKSNHSHGNNLNQIGASGAENREHAG